VETTRKTITLSGQQDAWIKARIQSGDYTNDSEYIRDLIRRDQEVLRQAIQEGLSSGVSKRTMKGIWAAARKRAHGRSGMTSRKPRHARP
jgi:antitoxin ParD1/3/4